MSASKRFVKKGFTLVEILIVVVILGILAAIVIPQFTSASESAKGSSLHSQLQTIRSQLELYQVQHSGEYPTLTAAAAGVTGWEAMTSKVDDLGPYLQQAPKNPFTGGSTVDIAGGNAGDWSYNSTTGVIKPVLTKAQGDALDWTGGTEYVLKAAAGE